MENANQSCAASADANFNYNSPVILITFILGLAGNTTALWIFCFHVKSRRPNVVYSLNLMIADTLLMCCLPIRAHYFIKEKDWIFGDVPCRLNIFMISLNRVGSVIFLMAIAVDRYFKVVRPFHKVNKITPRCAAMLAGALWVMAVGICLHLLVEPHHFYQNNTRTYCEPFNITNPRRPMAIWTNIVFIFFTFILPVSVLVFSSSCIIWKLRQMETEMRRKYKRTVKLVIAVVVVFVICFLPTNIAVVAVLVTMQNPTDCNITAVNIFYNTLFVTYLNSVIDPVIYYFSNSAFRDALRKALVHLNLRSCKSATSQDNEQGESQGQTLDQQTTSVTHL
ncbi:hydroxycarboxylic acid receptor 3-like [Amblyraja radiata]|uniref:hydroxycarboxylic acid receptor 3-like n=1 Tax=Amblyraja radiata TaxID=386614 RepID=UPI00140309C9|nr:hydroxycarboxylic acid receptor 3-like [Amblyraja radiata]